MKQPTFTEAHGDQRSQEHGPHEHDVARHIALVALSLHGRRPDATEIDQFWQGLLGGDWQLADRSTATVTAT